MGTRILCLAVVTAALAAGVGAAELDIRRGGSLWARFDADGWIRVDGSLVGRFESDGTVRGVMANLTGTVREVDYGTWKPGDKATVKYKMSLLYYKLEVDGQIVHEIDILNYKRIVNGRDLLAGLRAALGV